MEGSHFLLYCMAARGWEGTRVHWMWLRSGACR